MKLKSASKITRSDSNSEEITRELKKFYTEHDKLPNLIEGETIMHKSVKDLYVLPHLSVVDENDKASSYQQENLFNEKDKTYPDRKFLLKAASGMGKTSFLQYMSFRWGSEEIYTNIKFVLRVDFKILNSDEKWTTFYNGPEIRANPLACLIHYYYFKEDENTNLTVEDVIYILQDKDETLLMVDATEIRKDILLTTKIYESIQEYKKMIMITGSDTLSKDEESDFDDIITISGFTNKEVRSYIDKFFETQKTQINEYIDNFVTNPPKYKKTKSLVSNSTPTIFKSRLLNFCTKEKSAIAKRILDIAQKIEGEDLSEITQSINVYFDQSKTIALDLINNPNLEGLLNIPMTVNMLCIVLSIPNSRTLLNEQITQASLYKEFMLLFAKRNIGDLDYNSLLEHPEFKIITELGYEAIRNKGVIEGDKIYKLVKLHKADPNRFNNIELLKKISPGEYTYSNISKHRFKFVNPMIQNFLAALKLKEMLNDENKQLEASNFIAEHRNEKKFLPTLKFLADFISNETKEQNDTPDVMYRFWEAVSCNINGELELGEDAMVTRFMHLLMSSANKEIIDKRIPNLDEIKEFIEKIVIKDLMKWSKTIKSSGYLPDRIMKQINDEIIAYVTKLNSVGDGNLSSKSSQKILDSRALLSIIYDWLERFDLDDLIPNLNLIVSSEKNLDILELVIRIYSKVLQNNLTNNSEKIASEELVKKISTLISQDDLFNSVKEYLKILLAQEKISNVEIIDVLFSQIVEKENPNLGKMITIFTGSSVEYILDKLIGIILTLEIGKHKNEWHNCANIIKELVNSREISEKVIEYFSQAIENIIISLENDSKEIRIKIGDIDISSDSPHASNLSSENIGLTKLIDIMINIVNNVNFEVKNQMMQSIKSRTATNFKYDILSLVDLKGLKPEILIYLLSEILTESHQKSAEVIEKVLSAGINLEMSLAKQVLEHLLSKNNLEQTKHSIYLLTNSLINDEEALQQIYALISSSDNIAITHTELAKFTQAKLPEKFSTDIYNDLLKKISESQVDNLSYFLPFINLLNDQLKVTNSNIKSSLLEKLTQNLRDFRLSKAFVELAKKFPSVEKDFISELFSRLERVSDDNQKLFIMDILIKLNFEFLQNISEAIHYYNQIFTVFVGEKLEIKQRKAVIIHKLINEAKVLIDQEKSDIIFDKLQDIKNLEALSLVIEVASNFPSHKLSNEVFNDLMSFLPQHCEDEVLQNLFLKVITPENINQYIDLLDSNNEDIRKFFSIVLKLHIDSSASIPIHILLNILNKRMFDYDSDFKMNLFFLCRTKLEEIAKNANDELIGEVTNKIQDYVDINPEEAMDFLKKLFTKALSDSVITKIESSLISKCITDYEFSISISSPFTNEQNEVEFTILFEDEEYPFAGINNLVYMEAFASMAVNYGKNDLAMQYKKQKPLFHNTGKGIRKAAIDVPNCISKITNEELNDQEWVFSYIYKSDDVKSSLQDVFIIIERRILGMYIVDKVSLKNMKLVREHYIKHPDDLDSEFYEKIFGPMIYSNNKPMVYSKSIIINPKTGSRLLRQIEGEEGNNDLKMSSYDVFDIIVPIKIRMRNSPQGKRSSITAINRSIDEIFFGKISSIVNNFPTDSNLFEQLAIKGKLSLEEDLSEHTKKELIEDSQRDRNDSIRITESRLECRIKNIESLLKDLKIDIDRLHDIDLKRTTFKAKKNQELDTIANSDYKRSFYKAIRLQLNSFYIAASAIASGLVEGQSDNVYGKTGNILASISSHTPLVGVGVALIGEVLKGIGNSVQEYRIGAYQSLVSDSNEMAILSEKIARRLALLELNPIDTLSSLEEATDEISNAAKSPVAYAFQQISCIFNDHLRATEKMKFSGEISRDLIDFADRFIKGPEETEESRGEKSAKIIAKYIIKNIFVSKYKSNMRRDFLTNLADQILGDVSQHYASDIVSNLNPSPTSENDGSLTPDEIEVSIKVSSEPHTPTEPIQSSIPPAEQAQATTTTSASNNTNSWCLPWLCAVTDITYDNEELVVQIQKEARNRVILKNANEILEVHEMAKLIELIKENDFADSLSTDSESLRKELEVIFNKVPKDENLEAYKQIKEFLGLEADQLNFAKNLVSKNSFLQDLLSITGKVISNIQSMLTENLPNLEKITAFFLILDDLLNIQAKSGNFLKLPFYRPPYYDPDDYGGGFGGSGISQFKANNSSSNELSIAVALPYNVSEWNNEKILGLNTKIEDM